ncbi:acyl carrier protein [Burkholderia sp. TSV86]|uniref:acyl carrier protein n=1 Tax=Burkholderia sp. TSV86 TaxID=1385594 RepID=UPI003FA447C3
MLFNSFVFLTLFLPVSRAGYYAASARGGDLGMRRVGRLLWRVESRAHRPALDADRIQLRDEPRDPEIRRARLARMASPHGAGAWPRLRCCSSAPRNCAAKCVSRISNSEGAPMISTPLALTDVKPLVESIVLRHVEPDTPLIEFGLVNSVLAVEIVLRVDAEFGVQVPATEIAEHLASVHTLAVFIADNR